MIFAVFSSILSQDSLSAAAMRDDARDVLSAGALAALLRAALDESQQGDDLRLTYSTPTPFGDVELMAGHGEHVDIHAP